jgi:malate dehydrogenase (oxaloacetate-decarboxylating)(NADP+)
MKMACVMALAELAEAEQSDVVAMAYGEAETEFGPDYIIPRPFDPRLIIKIAPAVARAAMDSGVATRPIRDWDAYRQQLMQFVYHSGLIMRPVFAAAKQAPKRVIYAEGEDERVLRAVQVVVDEGLARPVLIGRPDVVTSRIKRYGLRIAAGKDFEIVNPESDARYREVWSEYHEVMGRHGVTPDVAKARVRQHTTLIGAMLLRRGEADAMLCGTFGTYEEHLEHIADLVGRAPGRSIYAAMNLLLMPNRTLFVCDTYVNEDPSAEEIAEMTLMAVEEVRRFGQTPKVGLLSHSNFGSSKSASARKMARARELLAQTVPDLELDGEMQGDAALSADIRAKLYPAAQLQGEANLLVMPNLDAANIAYNLLKITGGGGITIGPILLGCARPVHIVTPSATVRRIVNMTALASVGAANRQ